MGSHQQHALEPGEHAQTRAGMRGLLHRQRSATRHQARIEEEPEARIGVQPARSAYESRIAPDPLAGVPTERLALSVLWSSTGIVLVMGAYTFFVLHSNTLRAR